MTKYYKGYKIDYNIREDIKDATIYEGKVYNKDNSAVLCTIYSANETMMIKSYHNIVSDIISGKNIEQIYNNLSEEDNELVINADRRLYREVLPPLNVNFIVGDIIAPRLSDVIDTTEGIILIEKNEIESKYMGLFITENDKYDYIELGTRELINDYKIIGRVDPVVDIHCIKELRGLENRIIKIIDYCKNAIDNAINTFDKSEEEISNDLVEFIKNTKDIDETKRLQYLKVLGSEY